MVNITSGRTKDAVRQGALGLALLLPLLATTPARAQSEGDSSTDDALTVDVVGGKAKPADPEQIEVEIIEAAPEAEAVPVAQPFEEQPAAQPRVLISEVVVEGIAGHPEQERLELAAYDAMAVRPGSRVTRDDLKVDLDAIYASGWFSDVRIEPLNGPLGVKLVVKVVPNPVLTRVEFEQQDVKITDDVIADTFSSDYGRTLNLNELQLRMKELQRWYSKEGYSLARVSGPSRVTPEGVVQLKVLIGTVSGV